MTVVHKTVGLNWDLSTALQMGYCQYVPGRKTQVVLEPVHLLWCVHTVRHRHRHKHGDQQISTVLNGMVV